MSVWTSIGSAPGPDTDMRLVSLEPAWLKGDNCGIIFPKNDHWPNHRSKMFYPNAFL
jgi:hypothetical protein